MIRCDVLIELKGDDVLVGEIALMTSSIMRPIGRRKMSWIFTRLP